MRALVLALCLAAPAAAQDRLSPEEFLDFALGQTLTFSVPETGDVVGVEWFARRDLSLWSRAPDHCVDGTVWVEGATVCFAYPDRPGEEFCWWPMRVDGDLHVMSTTDFEMQRVTVAEGPPACGSHMS
ncbi:hypothetical protein JQC91_13800 [Jannaschia sp. Os4]|uniref:hypothetical protein n=1 Tax=Jannaschia sp. Os4 TaxID=2807617 RepID=UPI00193A0711|nr:hypothetical protein [Jannaschia sp. Os4]MBM2577378.1 hypothetical protein [Jannaschia sp. Os4]